MLIAPLAAMLGILPYFVPLNLTLMQGLGATLAALLMCYLIGAIIGGPGYLVLRRLGFAQSRYLLAYAALVVVVAAILFADVYVIVSLGPPVLLATGAFCLLRGEPAVASASG
jgi:ABC-type amino acid transport system permease subunit